MTAVTRLTLITGGLLVLTGIVAYVATGFASWTALIPTIVGALLLIAGLIARQGDSARKHATHAALLVALLGAAGSVMNVVRLPELFSGDATNPGAIIASTIMLVLLVIFLVAGIRSFIAVRRQSGSMQAGNA